MRQDERGEIATILMLGSLVVIAVTAVTSSFFVNKKQTTSSKAALACNSDQCAGASTCVPVGSKSNGLECCKAGQNKAHPEYTWATWGATCNTGDAHYGDNCCYIRTGTNAGGITGCKKAEDWNNFGTCTAGIPKCTTADKDNRKVCLEKADAPPPAGGGDTCPGKHDKTDACNDSCCDADAKCPSGQKCNIPNDYCKSGSSCNASPWGTVHLACDKNQCVKQPCMYEEQCKDDCAACGGSGASPSPSPASPGALTCPPNPGVKYEWADYGKTCVCMNCVKRGNLCASNDGSPGSKPMEVDGSLCCLPGQKGAGGTACGVYTDANCGKENKLCCPESTGKPACEGALSCDGTNCKAVVSGNPPDNLPGTAPNPNCEWFGEASCTSSACSNIDKTYSCTTDRDWCCPSSSGGGLPAACTKLGFTSSDKLSCSAYCQGGNSEKHYYTKLGSFYDEDSCGNINETIKSYCGCNGGSDDKACGYDATIWGCSGGCGDGGGTCQEVHEGSCQCVGAPSPTPSQCYYDAASQQCVSGCGTNGGTCTEEGEGHCVCTGATVDTCSGTGTCTGGCVDKNKVCKVFQNNQCSCVTQTYLPNIQNGSGTPVYGDAQCSGLGSGSYCSTSKTDRACGTDADQTETVCGPDAANQNGKCCKLKAPFDPNKADYTSLGTANVTITLNNPGGRDLNEEKGRFHFDADSHCSAVGFTLSGNTLSLKCSNLERFTGQKTQVSHAYRVYYTGRTGVGDQTLATGTLVFRADELTRQVSASYDFGSITKSLSISLDTTCASLLLTRYSVSLEGGPKDMLSSDTKITPGQPWTFSSTFDSSSDPSTLVVKNATCESSKGTGFSVLGEKRFTKSAGSGNVFVGIIEE